MNENNREWWVWHAHHDVLAERYAPTDLAYRVESIFAKPPHEVPERLRHMRPVLDQDAMNKLIHTYPEVTRANTIYTRYLAGDARQALAMFHAADCTVPNCRWSWEHNRLMLPEESEPSTVTFAGRPIQTGRMTLAN